jgi:amidohydrolase
MLGIWCGPARRMTMMIRLDGIKSLMWPVMWSVTTLGVTMGRADAADPAVLGGLDALYPKLSELYTHLHQNPELSLCEEKTAALLATRLRELGYEVTEKVGGFGVVAMLRNGAGPTVLLRADMDALPVEEKTGAAYASKKRMLNHLGQEMPVMHACGHDVHMTSLVGAAELLVQCKSAWSGTLMLIGQPAEEGFAGAKAMVKDGLFERFGKPDFCLGLHVDSRMPAGQIGVTSGPVFAASDSVDITVYGVGGHGSAPHWTVDPIVIAARIVGSLQTVVSREVDPLDSAVVTVGSFHAGTKRNIIPEEAKLELTVRTYKPETRRRVLDAIERIAKAEAMAGGAKKEPLVRQPDGEGYDMVVNEPGLTERLAAMLEQSVGKSAVVRIEPVMGSEDFGVFGSVAKVPSIQFRFGVVNEQLYADAKAKGRLLLLPSPHSPYFLPDQEPTIRTGVKIFTLSALEVLGKPVGK